MGIIINLVGMKFGRLTVLNQEGKVGRSIMWLCKCECGKEKAVRGNSLKMGNTKSCGCLKSEISKDIHTKHGCNKTSEYKAWANMLDRCENPNNPAYENYGGRGITVCEEWRTFKNFIEDIGNKPFPEYSIERIDNNKGYYPDNCKWANSTDQSVNRRNQKNNKSGIRGVEIITTNRGKIKYRSTITVNKKQINLGVFDILDDAAKARKEAEKIYWDKN